MTFLSSDDVARRTDQPGRGLHRCSTRAQPFGSAASRPGSGWLRFAAVRRHVRVVAAESVTLSVNTADFNAVEGVSTSPSPIVLHAHLLGDAASNLGAADVAPQTQPTWFNVSITGGPPDDDVTLPAHIHQRRKAPLHSDSDE